MPRSLLVCQHEITFEPSVKTKMGRRRALHELEPALSVHLGGGQAAKAWAYDGDKILYTLGPINAGAPLELTLRPEAPTPQTCRIRPVATHDLSGLTTHFGDAGTVVGDTRPLMQVLDVVLKHSKSMRCKTVGQSIYETDDPSQHISLGREPCDAELWFGYRQTVVHTEIGPMLQIDLAASSMLAPINCLKFIAMKLKVSDVGFVELSPADLSLLNMRLANKLVRSMHNGRKWRVRGLSGVPASQVGLQRRLTRAASILPG